MEHCREMMPDELCAGLTHKKENVNNAEYALVATSARPRRRSIRYL